MKRKGKVIGVGGHTSLGPGEMGNEAPASSWGCCTDSRSPGKALTRGFQELRFPQLFVSIRLRPKCLLRTNASDFLQNSLT